MSNLLEKVEKDKLSKLEVWGSWQRVEEEQIGKEGSGEYA